MKNEALEKIEELLASLRNLYDSNIFDKKEIEERIKEFSESVSYDQLDYPETYRKHSVFNEISNIAQLYNSLGITCYSFAAEGAPGIFNYTTYVFGSIQGTLESISTLLKNGRINDAYVLTRKFFDDVLTEIYIDVVREEKWHVFENPIVKDVKDWINSKLKIPSIKNIKSKLKESKSTKDLYPYFGWETYLDDNRKYLNDRVHGNRFHSMLLNCNTVMIDERQKQLDNIETLLTQIITIHISFIFHLHPEYLMASDYTDFLDIGETPPKGSQYWIAPFAQEAFDRYIKPRKELCEFIKSSCNLEIQ